MIWRGKAEEAMTIAWLALGAFSPTEWLSVVAYVAAALSFSCAIACGISAWLRKE